MAHDLHGFFDALSTDVHFAIADGKVTGVEHVFGTQSIPAHLPASATFTVGAVTVTETLAHGATTDTLTYKADAADATLYHLTQDRAVFDTGAANARIVGFTVADGKVTALTENHGDAAGTHAAHAARTIDLTKLPATAFTASGNTVTETTVHGNVLETLTFISTDGTAYKLASDTRAYMPAGGATTLLDVEPHERMHFTFSGSTVTAAQTVEPDGTTVDLPAHSSATVAYAQPAAGYVVETVTRGAHSFYEVYHDGNGDGVYTAVAHGAGTAVDLVGLQAQVSAAIDALL